MIYDGYIVGYGDIKWDYIVGIEWELFTGFCEGFMGLNGILRDWMRSTTNIMGVCANGIKGIYTRNSRTKIGSTHLCDSDWQHAATHTTRPDDLACHHKMMRR